MGFFSRLKKFGGRVIRKAKELGGRAIRKAKEFGKLALEKGRGYAADFVRGIPYVGEAGAALIEGKGLKEAGMQLVEEIPIIGNVIEKAREAKGRAREIIQDVKKRGGEAVQDLKKQGKAEFNKVIPKRVKF